MSTRTKVRPATRRTRTPHATSSKRPGVATPRPLQQEVAGVPDKKRIDWFIVALYALMLSGIAVFSALAYMLFVPAI